MTLFAAKCLCGPRAPRASLLRDRAPPRPGRADPTGTSGIVRSWGADLDRRWLALRRMVGEVVRDRTNPATVIGHSALTGQDPIRAFQSWFDEALRQVVLGVNGFWLLDYVRRATDMGAMHAGAKPTAPVATGGILTNGVQTSWSYSAPVPADRTYLLQSLAITELQGIMEAVSQQAVRVFGSGALLKLSASKIAADIRQVVDVVGRRRGRLLVNFMAVRAFNAAAIDGFRARGATLLDTVPERISGSRRTVGDAGENLVEVLTAGDDDVCPQCQDISDEGPYTLDEAERLIPAHPYCRCAFVPWADERFAPVRDAFDPNQPRDKDGKWTEGENEDVRDIKTSLPVDIGGYLEAADVANQEADKRGELGRNATTWPIENVPVSKLVATQPGLNSKVLARYKTNTSDKLVVVLEYKGKFYISDGHHRAEAAVQNGAHTVRAYVRHVGKWVPPIKDSATHIASGILIQADNTGRVLLLRRSPSSTDHAGEWAFPAGAVEAGETIEQAAVRETFEEVGVPLDLGSLEQVDRRLSKDGVDFTTYRAVVDVEFTPILNGEHTDYVWAALRTDEVPSPLHPGVATTLYTLGDAWNEEDHPHDKYGMFTSGASPTSILATLKSKAEGDQRKNAAERTWGSHDEPLPGGGFLRTVVSPRQGNSRGVRRSGHMTASYVRVTPSGEKLPMSLKAAEEFVRNMKERP